MEQYVQHGAIGVAAHRIRSVAIEAVLADIEIKGRQVFVAEIDQQAGIGVEVVILDRLAQLAVQIGQQGQDIAFQLGDFPGIAHVAHETVQRAQQIAEGIAQFAILVAHALENFIADAVILGEIDAQRPQADDVGAILLHHLERVDGIAQALGHLAPVARHGEAMGQDLVEGRAAARRAAFQQARLEPAAMLVAAFQIEVGGPLHVRPASRFEDEGMGAARIEPDVENVGDHLVIVGTVRGTEEFGLARLVPGIDALFAYGSDHAGVHVCILQIFARAVLHEQRDRHAPGALARQHPVGAAFDHRTDAVAALFGNEARVGDRLQGAAAQRAATGKVLVHRHEPLRRAAIDDLGLAAPAMRIGMLVVVAGGQQPTGFAQVRTDRPFGRIERLVDDAAAAFPAVRVHIAPTQPFPVVAITPVGHDGEHRLDAMLAAQQEIVLAVIG